MRLSPAAAPDPLSHPLFDGGKGAQALAGDGTSCVLMLAGRELVVEGSAAEVLKKISDAMVWAMTELLKPRREPRILAL